MNVRTSTLAVLLLAAVAGCGDSANQDAETAPTSIESAPPTAATTDAASNPPTQNDSPRSAGSIAIGSEEACSGALEQAAEGNRVDREEGFLDVAIVVCPNADSVQSNLKSVGLDTTTYDLDFLLVRCQEEALIGSVCTELLGQED